MAALMHHFAGIKGSAGPFDKLVLFRCKWTRVFGCSLRPVPVKHIFPVDVPTKLKAAVADSSVSPVPETQMDRWKRQRNAQGESMLTIWLVEEISLFRKLCNGIGLNLNLEPGNKVDFDFVVENCVKSTIENTSRSPCQSLFKKWSPLLFPNT